MNKVLTYDQVEEMFKEHLKTIGPNPGSGWISRWGWHNKQRHMFVKELKDKGYTIGTDTTT